MTAIYVVAAYVGSAGQWWEFDRRWRRSMDKLGIGGIGCHASKCATGAKPYQHATPQQRHEIQRRLIGDILDSGVFGCVAASALEGWRRKKKLFSDFLGKDLRKFNEPHLLAHRQCVQLMIRVTGDATREAIAFVFDRNTDTGGRAREWYHQTIKSSALPAEDRARMGPYSEGERTKTLGLQAADILAYAAFRHFSGRPSWQWNELIAAKGVSAMLFGELYWQELEDDIAEAMRKKAEPT